MPSRRVLVTGAGGFIGSHLVEELVAAGEQVRALAQYNSFNSWGWLDTLAPQVRASVEVIAGDIRDAHFVRGIVAGCDVVYHLAALIAIPYSYIAPDAYVATNVGGTLNVLLAARDYGVSKVIHTSTSEVYGSALSLPISENHPLQAQSPYAATKVAADQLALSFHRSFELPVALLRPFNTYGPRQSARAVLPTIITQILSGKRLIHLGALSPTRDFTFVKDTVRAFRCLATSDQGIGDVINSGSNFEVAIGDAARLVADVMGVEIAIEQDNERVRPAKSEVERLWADNSKAARLIGWVPEYGGLEGFRRGLTETIEWLREPANLACYKADQYNQ
jgi:NAD dependent epimerase/dehydratase